MGIFDSGQGLFVPEKEEYRRRKDEYTITITRKGSMSYLKYNGIVYSMLDSEHPYTHSYHDYFLPLPLLYEKPRILVIGLGGGTIPYNLKRVYGSKVSMDVVEPNRDMIEICRKFLPKDGMDFDLLVGDGISHLKSRRGKYDIIMLDAYIDGNIPEDFLQDEFVGMAYNSLEKDGILAINYAMDYFWMYVYMRRLSRLFKVSRIGHILFGNYILICSKSMGRREIKDRILRGMKPDSENAFLLKKYKSL
ncbi:MAG: hypothetical protein KGH50_01625 [Candidatus Micrarchaeota archaeon]|nr:hypothetical protein [Candidatus Micrarchaeota archaeon]